MSLGNLHHGSLILFSHGIVTFPAIKYQLKDPSRETITGFFFSYLLRDNNVGVK